MHTTTEGDLRGRTARGILRNDIELSNVLFQMAANFIKNLEEKPKNLKFTRRKKN